ncbi:MAG: GntR family transcriptional regulator [Pseudomonadota bacterium]
MTKSTHWSEIYRDLKRQIATKEIAAGTLLPTQAKLAEDLNTSRHTIRRALRKLHNDGLILSWQGKGAVVAGRLLTFQINEKTRFATHMRMRGHDVKVKMLKATKKRRLTQRVAEFLELSESDSVAFGEFMHYVDGSPTAIGRHYFNSSRFPDILLQFPAAPSVPEAFRRVGVPDYFRASTLVEVRKPTSYECLALGIPPLQPVIDLWGKNVDPGGVPIEVTEAIVRADTVRLEIGPHQIDDLV